MIFVTLGTQDKPFTRLLDYVEKANIEEEVIVQGGYTKYDSKKMKVLSYVSPEDFERYLSEARVVIGHGGVGTIMKALHKGKKVIACARLAKYGEHQNDHQKQIIENFKNAGYIMELDEEHHLEEVLKSLDAFEPKPVISNQEAFLKRFAEAIENI